MERGHSPTPLSVCVGCSPLMGLFLLCCDLSIPGPSKLASRGFLPSPSLPWGRRSIQFSLFGHWVGYSGQRAVGISLFWWLACRVVGLLLARSLGNGEPGPVLEDPSEW